MNNIGLLYFYFLSSLDYFHSSPVVILRPYIHQRFCFTQKCNSSVFKLCFCLLFFQSRMFLFFLLFSSQTIIRKTLLRDTGENLRRRFLQIFFIHVDFCQDVLSSLSAKSQLNRITMQYSMLKSFHKTSFYYKPRVCRARINRTTL